MIELIREAAWLVLAAWYLEYAAKLSEKIEKQLVSPDND